MTGLDATIARALAGFPAGTVTPIAKATAAHADSWANREESTWIDKM